MREILFRAKAINRNEGWSYRTNYKNGDWVYGLVTTMYDDRFPNLPAKMKNTDGVNGIDVDYKTIGEYTGLTDKNSTKIFEGDIVKTEQIIPVLGTNIFAVEYAHGNYFIRYNSAVLSLFSVNESAEVIGNIYDSPELIEG